jgi:hypothetical protein
MSAQVNVNRPLCCTPLSRALSLEDHQMVVLLVEELGADVNLPILTDVQGATPFLALHHAMLFDFL